jgi:Na+/H+-dicarboxylate symporter
MGLGVVLYFVVTTALAIIIGLAVARLINPGSLVEAGSLKASVAAVNSVPAAVPRLADLPQKLITLLPVTR